MTYPKITYWPNGIKKCEEYLINGMYHRINGPAVIEYNRNGTKCRKQYMENDQLHRLNGPALIKYDENGNKTYEEYWENGINLKMNTYNFEDKYLFCAQPLDCHYEKYVIIDCNIYDENFKIPQYIKFFLFDNIQAHFFTFHRGNPISKDRYITFIKKI